MCSAPFGVGPREFLAYGKGRLFFSVVFFPPMALQWDNVRIFLKLISSGRQPADPWTITRPQVFGRQGQKTRNWLIFLSRLFAGGKAQAGNTTPDFPKSGRKGGARDE
jgi:hypothetical protein